MTQHGDAGIEVKPYYSHICLSLFLFFMLATPISRLNGRGICKGLGRRALEKLNDSGIKVFRIERSTVKDIVEDFSDSKPEEIDPENACRNHRCH